MDVKTACITDRRGAEAASLNALTRYTGWIKSQTRAVFSLLYVCTAPIITIFERYLPLVARSRCRQFSKHTFSWSIIDPFLIVSFSLAFQTSTNSNLLRLLTMRAAGGRSVGPGSTHTRFEAATDDCRPRPPAARDVMQAAICTDIIQQRLGLLFVPILN